MSRKVITVLIVVALVIVIGVAVVAAAVGYTYYTGVLDHNPERNKGEEFGRTTDQKGCLDESLRRVSEDPEDGFLERHAKSELPSFTTGCFRTATATKEFCNLVPKQSDFFWAEGYVQTECQKRGLSEKVACTNVFRRVVKECDHHQER